MGIRAMMVRHEEFSWEMESTAEIKRLIKCQLCTVKSTLRTYFKYTVYNNIMYKIKGEISSR